MPIYSKAMMSM